MNETQPPPQSTSDSQLRPPVANARKLDGSVAPSTRFSDEIDNILRNAKDLATVRTLLVDCIIRHRKLRGAVWFGAVAPTKATVEVTRFDNDLVSQPDFQKWIEDHAGSASVAQQDVIVSHKKQQLTLIAMPESETNSVLCLITANASQKDVDSNVLAGRVLVRAFEQWRQTARVNDTLRQLDATSALLELVGRLEVASEVNEAARILADTVHAFLDCDSVAVGLRSATGILCNTEVIAGIADFDSNSTLVRRTNAALNEAIGRDAFTVYTACQTKTQSRRQANNHLGSSSLPQDGRGAESEELHGAQTIAHRKLAEESKSDVAVSVVLRTADGLVIGVLTAVGQRQLHSQAAECFLRALDVPAGNALATVRRAQRNPVSRMLRRVLGNSRLKVLILLSVTIAVAAFMVLPLPYRVACRFRCEPVERQFSVAPYNGLLKQTLVRPGDVVKPNQLLARMDDRQIRFELAGLVAEQERATTERRVYFAEDNISRSLMASLDEDRVRSRRQLLDHQLMNLEIRSQSAGLVLSGSIDRKENHPVQVGEMLYEIAPLDRIRLELAVPAEEVSHAAEGMEVEIRADRQVNEVLKGKIARIRPRSESINGENVFIVEVVIDNHDSNLMPGMEGSARILSARQPLGWILFHRAYEHVMTRWSW